MKGTNCKLGICAEKYGITVLWNKNMGLDQKTTLDMKFPGTVQMLTEGLPCILEDGTEKHMWRGSMHD